MFSFSGKESAHRPKAFDQRGRIPATAAQLLHIFVELIHKGSQRQACFNIIRSIQADPKIFAHPVDRESVVKMIVQHGLVAVRHLPTARSALTDDLDNRAPIEARLLRKMQRFAQSLHHPGNRDLVAHFGHLTRAAFADTATDTGIGVNHRRSLVEDISIAAAHDRQDTILRSSLPAGNRRINITDARVFGRGIEFFCHKCGHGGVVHKDAAFAHPRKCAVLAEANGTQVVVVAHARHHEIRPSHGLARGRSKGAAVLRGPGLSLCSCAVINGHLVTCFLQMSGHRIAHDTQTKERKFCHVLPPSCHFAYVGANPSSRLPKRNAVDQQNPKYQGNRRLMAFLFRWLLRLTAASILLGIAGAILVYFLAAQSLPEYDKEIALPGPTAPVEIVRDHANVPHIFGSFGASDEDVFFGLGYAHAQDRLWQMAVMRRTAQGRLSEVFGARTVETDVFLRRLDLYRLARASVSVQSPETLRALEAYSAGVNARLQEINERALGRGAPEMFLFNMPIAPWQPADSIALMKLMALQLSSHMREEILRAQTSIALDDPERLSDILPDAPGSGTTTLPEYTSLFPGIDQLQLAPEHFAALMPVAPRGLGGASNAWAAAPSRSAAGGTLLANDPHLKLTAPGAWYLARLELGTGGVIGGTIPGIPAILTGRSQHMGWGITSSYLDDQDLFIEKINPDNPQQYLSVNGFKDFETRPSIIQIKGQEPRTLTLRWTDNGPVLPGSLFNLASITPPGHVVSLGWTALTGEDTSMTAALELMRAQTVQQAIDAGENFIAPSQNVTLADDTTIALKTVGAMPDRDLRNQSQGRLPNQGWRRENQWQGRIPYAANPEFVAPQGGILGNTNNKLLDRPFPNHVSFEWGDTQRINRWRRLMQTREVHTRDSFIEAQLDTVSYSARTLLPLIGADLWFTGEAAPDGSPARQRQIALSLLAEWNGEMNEHLPEPLIYASWVRALQKRLIEDDLGPLANEFKRVEPLFLERVFRNVDGAAAWCDVQQSAPVETCTNMARLALDDALVYISENYGNALEALRWGDAHQATQDHEVLGDVPLLRYFVNIRQSTSGGDNTLQRGLTSGSEPDPFSNVHAAGYRGVYDFADPDSSVFIIATGQSGHFLSRYYDDMAQFWRRGEYIPMSLDENLARAAAVGVTRILPRN